MTSKYFQFGGVVGGADKVGFGGAMGSCVHAPGS